MPKSRRKAVRMISPVSNTACLVISPGTCASGMWMVSGTTRNWSDASIITARRAPVRCARNSVWPGKAKPAAFSTALWMGAVTIAAASPFRHLATAISIASVTAGALAGSGLPGAAWAWGAGGNDIGVTPEHRRIAHQPQRMRTHFAAEMREGGKRHLGPNARRFAHGDEDIWLHLNG